MVAIGLMIEGQWGLTWERWGKLLDLAERLGFDCVFRSDHYTIGPPDQDSLETFVSLTYAAGNTQRIEFGPLVAPTTFRHPALTARMAAAIDDLSGGRMVIGLGTGWHEREHKQFGIPFYDQNTRYEMLEDALEITTRLYNSDTPVSYDGKHFSLDEAILLPRPKRAGGPPILIGGNGMKRTLPLAAKYASEWNGVHLSPSGFRERNQRLTELLDANNRPQSAVKRSLMTEIIYGVDDAQLKDKLSKQANPPDDRRIVGTASAVIDALGAYDEAGASRVMLMWADQDDLEGLEHLASNIIPHFHK